MPDIIIGNAVVSRSGLQAVQLDLQKILESSALNEAVRPALARTCPRAGRARTVDCSHPHRGQRTAGPMEDYRDHYLWVRPQMIRKLCT